MTLDEALALYHAGPNVVVKIKNSSNSSKPLSSDIINPKPKKKKKGNRNGGIGEDPLHELHGGGH